MRVIHTSDWHLGHTLREQSREDEHGAFLAWLLDRLDETAADALLIAGDVFDQANPPSTAQRRFYRFLAEARRRQPALDIVVIGGNHDSAARLDAPRPLLEVAGVRMVGGLPRLKDRRLDLDRLVVPLHDKAGQVGAWVAAVPFLRPSDLPRVEAADPLIGGVARLYGEVLDHARGLRQPDQALLAMGHAYLAGAQVSDDSERKVLGGNQHGLPTSIFPNDIAYVALGHLHLPQALGTDRIRYCGSPIPLSLAEADYPHQVVQLDLEGSELRAVTPLLIPRAVEIIRMPPAPIDTVLARLFALPALPADLPGWRRPFLEVSVIMDGTADVKGKIEKALEGKAARLVSLRHVREQSDSSLADALPRADLQSLSPEAVFRRRFEALRKGEPTAELLSAFHELLDEVSREGA
jgi:exonuclease SbcD